MLESRCCYCCCCCGCGCWRGRGLPQIHGQALGGILTLEEWSWGGWGGAATVLWLAVPSVGAARLGFCHVFVYLSADVKHTHTDSQLRACVQSPHSTLTKIRNSTGKKREAKIGEYNWGSRVRLCSSIQQMNARSSARDRGCIKIQSLRSSKPGGGGQRQGQRPSQRDSEVLDTDDGASLIWSFPGLKSSSAIPRISNQPSQAQQYHP